MPTCRFRSVLSILLLVSGATASHGRAAEPPLRVLFLGHDGPAHEPVLRYRSIEPALAGRGIAVEYTDSVRDLNPGKLAGIDALLIYANIDRIEPPQEKALLEYVRGGGALVALHCASFCFRNSPDYVAMVGAQFQSHGTGVFSVRTADRSHPIMQDYPGLESWDETYVHTRHNEQGRTVLEQRPFENGGLEPWTWVRTEGKGRVFYTAWGHDLRTWEQPAFVELVARGIRWTARRTTPQALARQKTAAPERKPFPMPQMTTIAADAAPFESEEVGAKIPNYTAGGQWGTQGAPLTTMQRPLTAAQSIGHYVVPQGFRLAVFAAEPDLGGKPICMNWDERGRLWVAETYDYPNELQPPGRGRDRIRICEDTDGDGRADRFTVFAEGLSIPTAIEFARGGAIVQNATETLFLKDTDGDDVADVRETLIVGWNARDTHGGVSNFHYGLDNHVWAMQGYNRSTPHSPGTEDAQTFAAGFLRFRPDGTGIEFLRSTDNNTWGLGLSEEGIAFGSTANHNPSVHMAIPNRYYERVRGWTPSLVLRSIADSHLFEPITDKVRQVDHHGGYTAGAGHALYTARTYPQQYWNRTAFVNGPTGHLTGTFVLEPDGAGFRSRSPFNLAASDDEWAAPIMAEVGPDGHVWLVDWYNYIVQHNPTPQGFETGKGQAYETDLRDKTYGRVYRVVHEAVPATEPYSLAGATPEKLVAALTHDNFRWRLHAQRLLVERGRRDVLPALFELVADRSRDAIGLNVGAIHALWTMHGLGVLDGSNADASAAAVAALRHPSPGVRRNAVQVLPPTEDSTRAVLEADLLRDVDDQVRLTALLALADLPASSGAGVAVAQFAEAPANVADPWLRDATVAAAARNAGTFLQAVAAKDAVSEHGDEVLAVVAEHFARGGPSDDLHSLIVRLAQAEPAVAATVIRGLAAGWPADRKPEVSDRMERDLLNLMGKLGPAEQGRLLQLAGRWDVKVLESYGEQITAFLLKQIDDDTLDTPTRLAAAAKAVELRPQAAEPVEALLERITPQTPPALATGLMDALGRSESGRLGPLVRERLGSLTPAVRKTAIEVLLGRTESTAALLDALDEGIVQLADLSLEQKAALGDHPDSAIRDRATKLLARGGAMPDADRQAVLARLMSVTQRTGDAERGKAVFVKVCANCHKHGELGQKVGPDLTGMAAHPKPELLTHILDPSRSVESNFRSYMLLTAEGELLNGMLASESKTAVELIDAQAKRHTVLREDIEQLRGSTKSLMPDGFEKQLSEEQLTDLLEFLAARGRYLPLDLTAVATAASDTRLFNGPRGDDVEKLIPPAWGIQTVEGVPFLVADPQGGTKPNAIVLHGPNGAVSRTFPKSVTLPVAGRVKTLHLLGGIGGWAFPFDREPTVSMTVRLRYADGATEDHDLVNGRHIADYIRRVDVPESQFAFMMRGQQARYLTVTPRRDEPLAAVEFVKGADRTAPVVLAVTIE